MPLRADLAYEMTCIDFATHDSDTDTSYCLYATYVKWDPVTPEKVPCENCASLEKTMCTHVRESHKRGDEEDPSCVVDHPLPYHEVYVDVELVRTSVYVVCT